MRSVGALLMILFGVCACTRPFAQQWPDGSNKRLGTLVSGKQEGDWEYYYPGGALWAQGAFAQDLQEGEWTYYHPDGSLAARGAYHRGLRHGPWLWTRPDGTVERKGSYVQDRQVGLWLCFDASSQVEAAAYFQAGLADGPWFAREAQGFSAGLMAAGARVGAWFGQGEGVPEDGAVHEQGQQYGVWRLDHGQPLLLADRGGERVLLWDRQGQVQAEPDPAQVKAILGGLAPLHRIAGALPNVPASSQSAGPVLPLPEAVSGVQEPERVPGDELLQPATALPAFWTAGQEARAAATLRQYRTGGAALEIYNAAPTENAQVDRSQPAWHGQALPQQRFLAGNGKVLDLQSWRGNPVAVVILRGFAGQVCLYCAGQTAALVAERERLERAGLRVLVVYPGSPASLSPFLAAVRSLGSEPALPVCLDPDLALVRSLGLEGNIARPATLILDREGLVRWSHVGVDIADRPSVADLVDAVGALP